MNKEQAERKCKEYLDSMQGKIYKLRGRGDRCLIEIISIATKTDQPDVFQILCSFKHLDKDVTTKPLEEIGRFLELHIPVEQ